jgi:hypothetical protein
VAEKAKEDASAEAWLVNDKDPGFAKFSFAVTFSEPGAMLAPIQIWNQLSPSELHE